MSSRFRIVAPLLLAGLATGIVLVSGGRGPTVPLSASVGAPKITQSPAAGLAPQAPASVATLAPNPGSEVACSTLPYPGGLAEEEQLQSCWEVEPSGSANYLTFEFFMGGRSQSNAQQGLLIFERQNSSGLPPSSAFAVPGNGGPITITRARWDYACYTTAAGGAGEFNANSAAFVTNQSQISTDCG
jgi:hypothetical protein